MTPIIISIHLSDYSHSGSSNRLLNPVNLILTMSLISGNRGPWHLFWLCVNLLVI